MVAHTKTTVGTATRGVTTGSLFQWDPDIFTALATGVVTTLAQVEVVDALALSIFLQNDAAQTGDIDQFGIEVSDDNTNWSPIFNKLLNPAINAAEKFLVCEIAGWKWRYIRVRAVCLVNTASAKCFITGSIFSASQTIITAKEYDAFQKSFSRNVTWSSISPNTAVPSANEGIDISETDFAFYRIDPSVTGDFVLWGKDHLNTWSAIDGSRRFANDEPLTNRLKVSGLKRLYIQVESGTANTWLGKVG